MRACGVVSSYKKVTVNGCVSRRSVALRACRGYCDSTALQKQPRYKTNCYCCKPQMRFLVIELVCRNGANKLYKMPQVTDCKCSRCSPTSQVTTPPPKGFYLCYINLVQTGLFCLPGTERGKEEGLKCL